MPPPELPPRALSPASVATSSAWHSPRQSNKPQSPPRASEQGNATVGRSHGAGISTMFCELQVIYN